MEGGATLHIVGASARYKWFPRGNMLWPRVDWTEGENRIATWFRSRKKIGPFGPLTYMHRVGSQDRPTCGLASVMCC